MIVPTPEFDPLFSQDGVEFREKMIAYIHQEFADLLESDADFPRLFDPSPAAISFRQGLEMRLKARCQPSRPVLGSLRDAG